MCRSYENVWDFAYRLKCSTKDLTELRCITLDPPDRYICKDWSEEQQFPPIHQIVFGRSKKTLAAELGENPNAVYATDAMGRTALDWATSRCQLHDMRMLIDCGSPLNTIDVDDRTTTLHAVDSNNGDGLRMLLEAGTAANPPESKKRSSPLSAATTGGFTGIVELLLQFGAKVENFNPEGRTALHVAASKQHTQCARHLLNYGASPINISRDGSSPLAIAISSNSYDMLELFMKYCDAGRQMNGLGLLSTIREFADAKTRSILASSELLKSILASEDRIFEGPAMSS